MTRIFDIKIKLWSLFRFLFRTNTFKADFKIIESLPNLKLLEYKRRTRSNATTNSFCFNFTINIEFYLLRFKLAKTNKSFLRFERTLIKYYNITYFSFQFRCQFLMILCLTFPYLLKLIKVVLTIEYLIFKTIIRIGIKASHKILPHCLTIEKQLFTTISNSSKITT